LFPALSRILNFENGMKIGKAVLFCEKYLKIGVLQKSVFFRKSAIFAKIGVFLENRRFCEKYIKIGVLQKSVFLRKSDFSRKSAIFAKIGVFRENRRFAKNI
jgi:hypothetical protein